MDKRRLKSLLYSYEVRIAAVVSSGVLNRASRRDTLQNVRQELLRVRLDPLEKNRMWQFATSFYKHCIAGAQRETDVQKRAEKLYAVLRDENQTLEHVKNEIADNIEFRFKHDELTRALQGEENFFYCTAHKNPADGHAAYQDKIYYRRFGNLTSEEQRFVRSHRLLAVEDVVVGPVWLCTRRNCKHRLIPISFQSAQTGDFRGETYSSELTYEEEQFYAYRDRLKMLTNLKKSFTSVDGVNVPTQMKLDIKKTYRLCRAWKDKIKKSRN